MTQNLLRNCLSNDLLLALEEVTRLPPGAHLNQVRAPRVFLISSLVVVLGTGDQDIFLLATKLKLPIPLKDIQKTFLEGVDLRQKPPIGQNLERRKTPVSPEEGKAPRLLGVGRSRIRRGFRLRLRGRNSHHFQTP